MPARSNGNGIVDWVTQLVVHTDFRKQDIGKTLLFSVWGFSTHFCWGLITANPYAIRALEKATRRRCVAERIAKHKTTLHRLGAKKVRYVGNSRELVVSHHTSKINTRFFVDHGDLDATVASVVTNDKPWNLGMIEEGWEWFAFTFHDQPQISLNSQEIAAMLAVSDQVTKDAYSRMPMDESHRWAQFTDDEVMFIVGNCGLRAGDRLLDFGCGNGRHAISLAKQGMTVTGVDYVGSFVASAQGEASKKNLANAKFHEADCRTVDLASEFDCVICLYDVIGTYADNQENCKILRNVAHHLKHGGMALISVMSFEFTERRAKLYFNINEHPDKLLELPASSTMETTGDIFNPDYFLIESETEVVYRKEQFSAGPALPVELIVRDRRFRKTEIETMCRDVDLEVVWSRFVRAGRWNEPLGGDDNHAKEILLLCRKR